VCVYAHDSDVSSCGDGRACIEKRCPDQSGRMQRTRSVLHLSICAMCDVRCARCARTEEGLTAFAAPRPPPPPARSCTPNTQSHCRRHMPPPPTRPPPLVRQLLCRSRGHACVAPQSARGRADVRVECGALDVGVGSPARVQMRERLRLTIRAPAVFFEEGPVPIDEVRALISLPFRSLNDRGCHPQIICRDRPAAALAKAHAPPRSGSPRLCVSPPGSRCPGARTPPT
jgi:hypothetical protein